MDGEQGVRRRGIRRGVRLSRQRNLPLPANRAPERKRRRSAPPPGNISPAPLEVQRGELGGGAAPLPREAAENPRGRLPPRGVDEAEDPRESRSRRAQSPISGRRSAGRPGRYRPCGSMNRAAAAKMSPSEQATSCRAASFPVRVAAPLPHPPLRRLEPPGRTIPGKAREFPAEFAPHGRSSPSGPLARKFSPGRKEGPPGAPPRRRAIVRKAAREGAAGLRSPSPVEDGAAAPGGREAGQQDGIDREPVSALRLADRQGGRQGTFTPGCAFLYPGRGRRPHGENESPSRSSVEERGLLGRTCPERETSRNSGIVTAFRKKAAWIAPWKDPSPPSRNPCST